MISHTDTEMIVHEGRTYSQIPRSRQRGDKREEHGPESLLVFPWEGLGAVGQGHRAVDSWNDFGGLWALGVVPRCPAPGTGVISGRGIIGLVCER